MHGFLKFCLVGASGVIVDMTGLFVLFSRLAMPLSLAKAAATEVAILNNFVWNDLWTFRSESAKLTVHSRLARLVRFNAISVAGLCLNVALFQAQVHWFGANIYVANAAAIVLVAGFNYWMSRVFGWKAQSKVSPPPSTLLP